MNNVIDFNSRRNQILEQREQRKAELRKITEPVMECILSPEAYDPGITWEEYHTARHELKRLEVQDMNHAERYFEFHPDVEYDRWCEWCEQFNAIWSNDLKEMMGDDFDSSGDFPKWWNNLDHRKDPDYWINYVIQHILDHGYHPHETVDK